MAANPAFLLASSFAALSSAGVAVVLLGTGFDCPGGVGVADGGVDDGDAAGVLCPKETVEKARKAAKPRCVAERMGSLLSGARFLGLWGGRSSALLRRKYAPESYGTANRWRSEAARRSKKKALTSSAFFYERKAMPRLSAVEHSPPNEAGMLPGCLSRARPEKRAPGPPESKQGY